MERVLGGDMAGLTSALVREKPGDKMGFAVELLEDQDEEARELRCQIESLKSKVGN